MKKRMASRSPEIDTEKCTELVGGNRFDLVLIASARAREMMRRHKLSDSTEHIGAPVNTLLEIQEKKIGREYLKKI